MLSPFTTSSPFLVRLMPRCLCSLSNANRSAAVDHQSTSDIHNLQAVPSTSNTQPAFFPVVCNALHLIHTPPHPTGTCGHPNARTDQNDHL